MWGEPGMAKLADRGCILCQYTCFNNLAEDKVPGTEQVNFCWCFALFHLFYFCYKTKKIHQIKKQIENHHTIKELW